MKKIVSVIITFVLLMSLSVCALAVDLDDGLYEVPVTLMHKEDEKESFGNKYVAQVGLLQVRNGEMTITILLTTNMDGIEFSYYTNGALDGETKEGKSVNGVTVAGTKYEQGFEIPVMKSGDIGLKFSVPVMPMSPSARLRIDYDSAKLIEAYDTETTVHTTEVQTDENVSTEHETEVTENKLITNEESTEPVNEETTIENVTEITDTEETTAEISEQTENKNEKDMSPVIYAIILILLVAVVVITGKKIKEKLK